MKIWMLLAVTLVCAGGAYAQGRSSRGGSSAQPNQMIRIKEISGVGGDSDYTTAAPQVDAKWKKKINHTDNHRHRFRRQKEAHPRHPRGGNHLCAPL